MQSAKSARDKIVVVEVVVSTNHVTFLTNRFLRLISLPKSAIIVLVTSGIMAILKYRSVNPIYFFIIIYSLHSKLNLYVESWWNEKITENWIFT